MTGVTYHANTDEQGTYVLTGLQPDTYRISLVNNGFRSSIQGNLVVTVGQSATLSAVLEVGCTRLFIHHRKSRYCRLEIMF
jgi:hypothetical protein